MTRICRLVVIVALLLIQFEEHRAAPVQAAISARPKVAATKICGDVTGTGAITGTVTNAATGDPLQGVRVSARTLEMDFILGASAFTDADGRYTIDSLPSGQYLVMTEVENNQETTNRLVDQIYNSQPWPNQFDPVTVVDGETTTSIDFALQNGATLRGQVTDEDTSAPVGGGVSLYRKSNGAFPFTFVASTFIIAGSYVFEQGMPPGEYRLGYTSSSFGQPYLPEYYMDKPSLDQADSITVSQPITHLLNMDVKAADTITTVIPVQGTVTEDDTDTPLEGIRVSAINVDTGEVTSGGRTAEDGFYDLGLHPGMYKIWARPERPTFGLPDYLDYSGRYFGGDGSQENATVINVSNTLVENIDIALVMGTRIAGRITGDPGSVGVENATVAAYAMSKDFSDQDGVQYVNTTTDATGTYTLSALASGTYTVEVTLSSNECFLLPQARSQQVTVNGQGVIPNINLNLAQGGAFAGRLTDASDAGVRDVLEIEDADGNRVLGTFSAQTGYYFISSLPPGDYYLRIDRNGNSLYYGQADNRADADRITVQPGQVTESIDISVDTPSAPDKRIFFPSLHRE